MADLHGEIIYRDFKKPIFKKKIRDIEELETVFGNLKKKLR